MHGVVSGNCVEAKLTFVRNFVLSLVFYHSTAQINFIVGNMLICAVKWVWSELLRKIVCRLHEPNFDFAILNTTHDTIVKHNGLRKIEWNLLLVMRRAFVLEHH